MYAKFEPTISSIIMRSGRLILSFGCDTAFIWNPCRNVIISMNYVLSLVKQKILYLVKKSIYYTICSAIKFAWYPQRLAFKKQSRGH